MAKNPLENIQLDAGNLWREEHYTDLAVGSIRKLVPVKPDGTDDPARKPVFSATTNIMTPGGALPISGEIEAETLAGAVEKFPEAVNAAILQLQDDMIRMQQEQASKIVTPDDLRGRGNLII